MKPLYTLILTLLTLTASSQTLTTTDAEPVDTTQCATRMTGDMFYPMLPDFAWEMIIDHIVDNNCQLIGSRQSQYVGQVDANHRLCGFGYYIDQRDNQRIGLFRDGVFVYGITLTRTNAFVGSATHYASYSMSTACLEYVQPTSKAALMSECATRFVSINYANGDRYIGEAVDGQRHGLGIYYYGNGDFWFGQYRNGIRDGYGCLYASDHTLWIGRWQGEDVRRLELVRPL